MLTAEQRLAMAHAFYEAEVNHAAIKSSRSYTVGAGNHKTREHQTDDDRAKNMSLIAANLVAVGLITMDLKS